MTFQVLEKKDYTHSQYQATLYKHSTGLTHMHVETGSIEKTFAIGFGTFPEDSKGTPHILEHMALCGSQKYPTKDPFFSMLPRSVSTFMNAFTAGDFTVYPFATPEISDFNNLMDVYLDAVFNPLLTEQDFKQEGWRYQVNKEGKVEIQGVVYNEMKDAVINRGRVIHQSIQSALFPRTIYAVESGGDPEIIHSLTHAELKEFHRTHYHPSKGILVTSGDLDIATFQAKMNDYLSSMTITTVPHHEPSVHHQPSPTDPSFIEFPIPSAPGDLKNTYGLCFRMTEANSVLDELTVMILNDTTFSETGMFGRLFADNPHAQVKTSIGSNAPNATAIFYATAPNSDILEDIKLGIRHIQSHGIPKEELVIAYREAFIKAHDKTAAHYGAVGIDLSLEVIGKGLHHKNMFDQVSLLDVLAEHEATLLDPAHYQTWLQKHFTIDGPMLTFVGKNDPHYVQSIKAKETALLETLNASLTEEQKYHIQKDQNLLIEHQNQPKSLNLLPIFDIKKIPPEPPTRPKIQTLEEAPIPVLHIDTLPGPSSLSEINLMIDLSDLTPQQQKKVLLTNTYLGALGIGDLDWQEAPLYLQETSPNLDHSLVYYDIQSEQPKTKQYLKFTLNGLDEDLPNLLEGLERMINDSRFDDLERMHYLNEQERSALQSGMNNLAKKAASSFHQSLVNPHHHWKHQQGSVLNIIERLERNDIEADLKDLQDGLKMIQQAPKFIQTYGQKGAQQAGTALAHLLQHPELKPGETFRELPGIEVQRNETHPYTVCVGDYAGNTVTASWSFETNKTDKDFVAGTVLSNYLKSFYIHQAVREKGGAYTSSCAYDGYGFTMLSQRDPRHLETLRDFENAPQHLQEHGITDEDFYMAKLSVAKLFLHQIHGNQIAHNTFKSNLLKTEEEAAIIRKNLLDLTKEDVMRVAKTIFATTPSAITIGTTPLEADKILEKRPDFIKIDFLKEWTTKNPSKKTTIA